MKRLEIIRPAVWLGFTAFGTLLTAAFLGTLLSKIICAAAIFLSILLLITRIFTRNPYALLVLLTAAVFFGYYALSYQFTVAPYTCYAGNIYSIQAEILSLPEEDNGNFYYKARVYYIEETNESTDFSIRLSHRESLDAEIGDKIKCTVKFFDFDTKPGLSSKASNLARGCVLGGYIADHETITIQSDGIRNLRYYLASLRKHLETQIIAVLPTEEASVLSAMLIGIRDSIPEELNNDYRTAGAAHILVISGMHMSILTQFLLNALIFIGLRRKHAILLTLPAVLIFMAIAGFSVSVLRSGIMQIIMLIGLLLGRKADSLNSLAIAALIILSADPFAIGDISLLLSFTASLGMITLSPRLIEFCTAHIQNKKIKRGIHLLIAPIMSSFSAVLGTLPVQIYSFGTINLLSIPTSLLVLHASAWIIRLGLPTLILLSIPVLSPAAMPLLFITGLLVRFQNLIVKFTARLFPDPIYISGKYVHSTILIIIFFLLAARLISGKKPLSIIAYLSAAAIFCSSYAVNHITTHNDTKLLILNNTYSHCVAVKQNSSAVVLSCSGNAYQITDFLRNHGTNSIEWLFFGNIENEIRCAETLYSDFNTQNILLPDSVYFPSSVNSEIYHYGTTLSVLDDITLNLSSYGDWSSFELFGNRIIVDTDSAGYLPQHADVLITDTSSGPCSGALTIINSEDSFIDIAPTLSNGDYLLTSEHNLICLVFKSDGSYTIQHG